MNISFDIYIKYPQLLNSSIPELKIIEILGDFISLHLQQVKDRMDEEELKEPRAHLLVKMPTKEQTLSFSSIGYSYDLAIIIQTITHTIDFKSFDDRIGDLYQAINN